MVVYTANNYTDKSDRHAQLASYKHVASKPEIREEMKNNELDNSENITPFSLLSVNGTRFYKD